jgi:Protein of unknown function (DUF3618)
VAEQTDPDAIQREIERTRAELAVTIDALAEKVSPKRVFARTADRVKTRVKGDNRTGVRLGVPETGEQVDLEARGALPGPATSAADKHELYARATGLPGGSHAASLYAVRRTLRTDRVAAAAAGAVLLVVVAVVLVRRHGRDDFSDFDFDF